MEETYGPEVCTAGYKVWTTLDGKLQHVANAALRQTLQEYDSRHGFRMPERHLGTDAPGMAAGGTAGSSGSARTLLRHRGRGRRRSREHGRGAVPRARA